MKHYGNRLRFVFIRLFAASVLALVPSLALSQVKVTVSDEIVNVKGEKMYAHTVKKGETVYSICKAYEITAEELQVHNPAVEKGLKEGQLLYIPVKQKDTTDNTENSVQTDQTSYITHKVRWFEDLDEIAEKYGVSKEDIKAFNNMPSDKLKGFKKLKIPIKKSQPYTIVTDNQDNDVTVSRDTVTSTDIIFTEDPDTEPKIYTMPEIDREQTRSITLLLPLNSSGKPNGNYMDFYSGALMALEQIKQEGGNIRLNILDYSSKDLSEIVSDPAVEEADIIVGPIRYAALKELIPLANERRIPIVSPLDAAADSLLYDSPYLFQAALSRHRQNEAMAEMIAEKYRECPNPNVVLIYTPGSSNAAEAEQLKSILEEKGIYVDSAGGIGSLSGMKKDRDNLVIAYTTAESTAVEILRNIDIKMIEPSKITIFGLSKWKGFEAIDMNLYFKYNLQICMPYNVDLNRLDVKQFIRRYRSLYNREPSANAFSGFDILYFFCRSAVLGLREYAENPKNTVAYDYLEKELLQLNLLQQKFKFVKCPDGGWANTAATQVSFNPDYTVTSRMD